MGILSEDHLTNRELQERIIETKNHLISLDQNSRLYQKLSYHLEQLLMEERRRLQTHKDQLIEG